jgi:hypothetical protein
MAYRRVSSMGVMLEYEITESQITGLSSGSSSVTGNLFGISSIEGSGSGIANVYGSLFNFDKNLTLLTVKDRPFKLDIKDRIFIFKVGKDEQG